MRSYAAAERDDEGMALKILTRAEDMPAGKDNLESYASIKWKKSLKHNFHNRGERNEKEQR